MVEQCGEGCKADAAAALREIASCEAPYVKVGGGGGTGKTQAIALRVSCLLERGSSPEDIVVLTPTLGAADALRRRLADVAGTDRVPVCTVSSYCVALLSDKSARAVTGRIPRLLADFEERILVEDVKTVGVKPKRLREMLKFFYREWTELGDEADCFLIESEEEVVHRAVKEHVRMREAMLPQELSSIAYKYVRDHENESVRWKRRFVLADDFQNLNRASQLLVEALSTESLMVCGNVNEQVETCEPYPYPQGFQEFEDRHPDARTFVLTNGLRCPDRVISMANSLVRLGGLDESTLVGPGSEGREGEVRFVRWTLPEDEFKGIARYLVRRLREEGPALRPRDVFVCVPNAVWGRSLAKILSANGVPADVAVRRHALAGDPRSMEKSAALRAFTALNLVADERDVAAWRSWCGFGDYLTYSNHWCRLEGHAREQDMGVLEALSQIASASEPPFLGADVLGERYRAGMALVERARAKKGFALLGELKDEGAAGLPEALLELLNPVMGTETAAELLGRGRGRLESAFSSADAVRIGLAPLASGLSFDTVVIMGAVEGFWPSFEACDVSCDENRRAQVRLQERRAWYSLLTKARQTVVISCFAKDRSQAATAMGMWARRIRMENGESMAMLSPTCYLDELGDAAPGFDSNLE